MNIKEWSEANFDVNYQFEMQRMLRGEGYQTGMGPILDLSCTLFGLATINGYTKVVDVLAKAEADVSKVLGEGNTPLHLAAYYGHIEIADILIKAGVNPSTASDSENTNLHWAVFGNHEEVVSILIKEGANLNAVNGCKETPLNRAAKYNNTKMFDILTKAGADLLTFDKNWHVRQFLEKKAKKNGLYAGGASALSGTVAAVALFATGTVAVKLIPIVISVAAIATTALVVGGITYMMLKPSTKMDGVKEQDLKQNKQEIYS
ncbi:MAG: ankyrin repeat domain-containing protein [Wolbachia sp.]